MARGHQAQEHLRQRDPAAGGSEGRPVAYRVQSDRDGDREALVNESQSAEHPRARRARAADPARVRRAKRRVPLARGRLQSDRTPADGASFRRRSDAARVRRFAGYPRFHRTPDLRDHRRSRGQPQPAAHGKERQLRPLVRHVGLWAGAALGDRPGRGQRDHCRVLRALSLGTRAHRRHDRASEGGAGTFRRFSDAGDICPA